MFPVMGSLKLFNIFSGFFVLLVKVVEIPEKHIFLC